MGTSRRQWTRPPGKSLPAEKKTGGERKATRNRTKERPEMKNRIRHREMTGTNPKANVQGRKTANQAEARMETTKAKDAGTQIGEKEIMQAPDRDAKGALPKRLGEEGIVRRRAAHPIASPQPRERQI